MKEDPVVIVEAKRTPIGAFQGALKGFKAPELGAHVLQAVLSSGGLSVQDVIDEVLLGCALSAGVGQAPARQAMVKAGLPVRVPATTVNKVCGSGLRAIMMGADAIGAGSAHVVLAGGMESMTHAPYLLDKARSGYRLGHGELKDHMFLDGLEDAYEVGSLMGHLAERTAEALGFSREAQDTFALRSIERARRAQEEGAFAKEIVPILPSGTPSGASAGLSHDEPVALARPEKIPLLKPAFKPDGTITAANASGIADGAACVLLTRLSKARELGLVPRARIVGYTQYAQDPQHFATAPIGAAQKLLQKTGWTKESVDLWEVNEAFAIVIPNSININAS